MIFAEGRATLQAVEKNWKNSGLTGNRTLSFTTTGRNALSTELYLGQRVLTESRVAWLNQARLGKLHLLETTTALLTLGNTKHIRSVPWWIVRRPLGPSEIFPIPRRIKILFHLPPKSARCKEHIKQTEIYGLYLHFKVLNSGGHLQITALKTHRQSNSSESYFNYLKVLSCRIFLIRFAYHS